jgi:predicted amidohydrolase YtcJ
LRDVEISFFMLRLAFVSIPMILLAGASGPENACDLVLSNGKIWTENPRQPEAEAIAIRGNRVAAVGTSAEIAKLVGPATQKIDLAGRRVLPGFNDSHVHFFIGGTSLTSVRLRNVKSQAEFRATIAAFARSRPKGEWILNGSWDHENWAPAVLPTHQLIDNVTPDNPVFVNRLDAHMRLANALAMKLAGVDRNTPDVAGGVIVRDRDGNPTGIFKDAAGALIDKAIPPPTDAQIETAVLAAQRYAAENGVTSVQDMGLVGPTGTEIMVRIIGAYQRLERRGDLHIRIAVHLPLPEWRRFANAGIRADFGSEKVNVGAVKGFADGSLGSTTAWFFEPYTDAPQNSGIPSAELVDPASMYANIKGADQAGLQIAIHAIGDRANRTVLDFYERLEKEDGIRDRRLRIEHAQHLSPSDIPRFSRLHVIASMQPYHCIDDGRWAGNRIGPERVKTTYAFRSLLDSGAVLAFGSDWWVAPMEPLMVIYAAATRRTLDGKHPEGWIPEQKITIAEAIHGYTMGSAYASFEEKIKGSIEPGKLADLAVLSNDILQGDPTKIADATVDMTIFDGRVVYERDLAKRPSSTR